MWHPPDSRQAAYSKSKPLAAMQFAFRTAVLLSGMVRILSQAPFSFVKQTPRDKKSVARLQALDKLEQVRHEFAGHEECVHLIELACLPAAQGRGVGSALLRHICNLADERGQVAWLETDEPHLPAYYGKFGFNVVKEYVVAEGTEDEFVPNFGMRREARARKG
jgi:ribosomal protein S18 acetylase RimI-like enzyme